MTSHLWRSRFFLQACCFLLATVTAPLRADLPPIDHRAPATTQAGISQPQLILMTDANAQSATLRLPRSVIESLLSQRAKHVDSGISPTNTVIAGLSFSAALVVGGLMLVRNRPVRRSSIIVAVVLIGGSSASLLWADLAPYPWQHKRPVVSTSAPATLPVAIELSDDEMVHLTLPPNQLTQTGEPVPHHRDPGN